MAERRRLVIIQQAGRLLDLQACTPVYQLASRSVRIHNRPPWGGGARFNGTPGALPNGTSVHQDTSALLHPPGRPAEAAQNQIAIWSWPECSRWGAGACVRARKPYFSRSSLTFANTCCV